MKNFIVTHLKQITLAIGFLVVLISAGMFIYINKSNLSRPETKIILNYKNSGGFAGVCDHLQVFSDYHFLYEDTCRARFDNKYRMSGELSKEEVLTLTSLVKQFGIVNREWDDYKERGMVDGFAGQLKFYGENQKNPSQNQEQIGEFAQNIIKRVQVASMKLKITVVGIVRTSGLNSNEKSNLLLKYGNFQLTELDETERGRLSTDAQGFYLEVDDKQLKDYLGKCVLVTAETGIWHKVPEYAANSQYTYLRVSLTPDKIEKLDYKNCNPYPKRQDEIEGIKGEKMLLRGVFQHATRPAPDIGYDYELQGLESPIVEQSSGLGQKVYRVDVVPKDNLIWEEFEENIGKSVTIEGYLRWGYAESQYVLATSFIN